MRRDVELALAISGPLLLMLGWILMYLQTPELMFYGGLLMLSLINGGNMSILKYRYYLKEYHKYFEQHDLLDVQGEKAKGQWER